MLRPATLKTAEIFFSIQGEGLRQGEPTIFVRLSGCNLRCPFCDTKYARDKNKGSNLSLDEIVQKILRLQKKNPTRWVSLTGGEPLLQDIEPLVKKLHQNKILVHVETNGTLKPLPSVDWTTVSPKPPAYFFHPLFIKKANEVKLVVTRSLTFSEVARIRRQFPVKIPLILQPQDNAGWSQKKAVHFLKTACRQRLENIRILVQLHKILGLK